MPSQQMHHPQGFANAEANRSASLSGANILHKHSINSLLEQQDLIERSANQKMANANTLDNDALNISDILGLGNAFGTPQQPHSDTTASAMSSVFNPMLTPNSSSTSPGAFNMSPPKTSFDAFQFDNMAQNTPLKLFQRNFSYDSSNSQMSPPTAAHTNSVQHQQQQQHHQSSIGQQQQLQQQHQQQRNSHYHHGSPIYRECSSPLSSLHNNSTFSCNMSSGSNSPDSDYSAFSNMDNTNVVELMNYLSANQNHQSPSQRFLNSNNPFQHDQQTNSGNGNSGMSFGRATAGLTANDLQNLQTLRMLQQQQHHQQQQQQQHQHQQQQQQQQQLQLQQCKSLAQQLVQQASPGGGSLANMLLSATNQQTQNWQNLSAVMSSQCGTGNNANAADSNLDRMARFHRSSAAISDTTSTWSGVLPQRSAHAKVVNYSNKVFLGGIPPDITDAMFVDIFKAFGPIRIEWPGKEHQSSKPKGYVYVIFESEKQIRALLGSCTVQDGNPTNARKYFYKISGKCLKPQKIEIIPWIISDSNYVKSTSQKLDPGKTVFVGALHGQLTAEGLAKIMDELFEGVIYAGIDTDKHKYPLGSARVTFNNCHSYFKAVAAAFIDVRSSKFKRKVFQIDPYLEDSLCSACGVQHGPYFCRELSCFRYFCRTCWQWQHTSDASLRNHKPMTRNSKSQHLIGIGPQLQASSNGSNGGAGSPPCAASMSPSSSAGFASSLGNLYQTE